MMLSVNIEQFGASKDVDELQTTYIQDAIDYVFQNGGGTVKIPGGEYHITALRLRSNVCLHLLKDAVLIASRTIDDYFILKHDTVEPVDESMLDEGPWARGGGQSTVFHKYGSRWHNGIIRVLDAENVSIIGEEGSVIDGVNCFDEVGEEQYRGPHGTSIINCKNVLLRGYTVRHSGNWANMLQNCTNVLVENITAIAGHDGIHFTTCDDVTIRDCHFYTGDDCVAGFDNRNVLVENCEINSACSAFRMGGTDVLIQNCHIYAPAKYMFRGGMTREDKRAGINANDAKGVAPRYNMLSLFTYYADFSVVIRNTPGNIVIRDCVVEGADRFLHFNYSGNERWQNNRPLSNITFENIKATGISMPLTAYGDKNEPCSVTMKNVEFSFREGFEHTTFMHAANLKSLCMKNVTIHNAVGGKLVKLWGDIAPQTDMENICGNVDDNYIVPTDETFICQPI